MQTETLSLEQFIAQAQQSTEAARDRLLKTLSFVPDDKLQWSPNTTSRSALAIAAHCGMANGAFASIMKGEPLDVPSDPAKFGEFQRNAELAFRDRDVVIQLIKDNSDAAIAAIGAVTPEAFQTTPDSPAGAFPMALWMELPASHMNGHASQVDYLQTTWGDVEDHF